MERIFSVQVTSSVEAPAAGIIAINRQEVLYAEEDITVIGLQLSSKMLSTTPMGNDGFIDWDIAITPRDNVAQDGALCLLNGNAWWNTVPASIGISANPITTMFPKGHGFTMKEGESLAICWGGYNEQVAIVRLTCDGTIFYIRGVKARK